MKISNVSNIVTITGNIKSVNDFQEIKKTFDNLKKQNASITINLVDSISMTSSVIGYLNKLVLKDKISIQLKVGNKQLLELFEDLNLIKVFNAVKA